MRKALGYGDERGNRKAYRGQTRQDHGDALCAQHAPRDHPCGQDASHQDRRVDRRDRGRRRWQPYPWNDVSRITDDEMRDLMRDIVNRLYTFHVCADEPGLQAEIEKVDGGCWAVGRTRNRHNDAEAKKWHGLSMSASFTNATGNIVVLLF